VFDVVVVGASVVLRNLVFLQLVVVVGPGVVVINYATIYMD